MKPDDFVLAFNADHGRLELICTTELAFKPIYVDFSGGKSWHRYCYGGGKQQLIARAVGIKQQYRPVILDLTAGLGQDAFVFASLGCKVTMLERSPLIAALLADGLSRASREPWFKAIALVLVQTDAAIYLESMLQTQQPDVIYLDPMFPEREKSALVKKEMRILRQVVGDDSDAAALLAIALHKAKKRVVVKRPRLAPCLTERSPDVIYEGKSSRFDVYIPVTNDF